MLKINAITLGLAIIFSANAFGHTDEYLDTLTTPHGGQLRMAGASHFELVFKPDTLQVYVTDHAGTPTSVKDATGSATVLAGKSKQNITLTPKGDNLLEGAGTFDLAQPAKTIIKIQLSGQAPQQTLFDTSKINRSEGHAGHSH